MRTIPGCRFVAELPKDAEYKVFQGRLVLVGPIRPMKVVFTEKDIRDFCSHKELEEDGN